MSQLADFASTLAYELGDHPEEADSLIRFFIKIMDASGYEDDDTLWALGAAHSEVMKYVNTDHNEMLGAKLDEAAGRIQRERAQGVR
jgi:hypothetical protein